jgi:ABC-type multidrug transport system permease subunit
MSTINVKLYVHHRIYAGCKSQRRREVENMVSRGTIAAILVAPLAFLCGAQFVHLGDSLSEFIVLAFFIDMSFGLMVMCRVSKTAQA